MDMDDDDYWVEPAPPAWDFNSKRKISDAEIAELLSEFTELTTEQKNQKSKDLTKKVQDLKSSISIAETELAVFNLQPVHKQNFFDLCILSARCAQYRKELGNLYVEFAGTDYDLNIALKRIKISQLRLKGEFYKADRIEKLLQKSKEKGIYVAVDNS